MSEDLATNHEYDAGVFVSVGARPWDETSGDNVRGAGRSAQLLLGWRAYGISARPGAETKMLEQNPTLARSTSAVSVLAN